MVNVQSCCFANQTYWFFLTSLLTSASLDLKVPMDLLKNKRCLNQSLVLFYLLLYQLVVWTRSFREMTALPLKRVAIGV